jgi:predicted alpha/beta hydrolase family esterase
MLIISCGGQELARLPFQSKGFGGPQNDTENRVPKIIYNDPIIFVHGFLSSASIWGKARNFFLSNGYNVHELFAIEMGSNYESHERMNQLALNLKDFVNKVLKYTSREKVILISHSGNGLTVRKYLTKLEGITKVSKCVLIASPNKGMTYGIFSIIKPGSTLIKELNTPTDEISGAKILCIRGGNDIYFNGGYKNSPFLKGAKNITIPDADHIGLILSSETFKAILNFIRA